MIKFFFTIVLFLFCISQAHAQDKRFEYADSSLLNPPQSTEDAATGSYENSNGDEIVDILSDTTLHIGTVNISPDSISGWKNDERFAYMKHIDSLLKADQKQNEEPQENKTDNSGSFLFWLLTSPVTRFIFWTIAISFVLFILYRLFLSNGVFRKNTVSSAKAESPEEVEPITVSDYDRLILQSYKAGDYRLAVRYLFLKSLAHLSEKEFLQLSADKTNYQYVQEIRADKKNEFSSLVLTYEYIWYGNFQLSQETYTGVEKKYNLFYNKI